MRTALLLLLSCLFLKSAVLAQSPSAALDTTFGYGGIVRTDTAATKLRQARLLILPDGRLLLAGSYFYYDSNFDLLSEMRILRFQPDGRPDSSFGGTGVLSLPTGRPHTVAGLQVQQDGKILVAESRGRIERFLSDGSPDLTYNDSGHINLGFFGPYDALVASALQADGRLLVTGCVSQTYLLTLRFLPNGQPDSTFGFNGMLTTSIAGSRSLIGTSLAVQQDGKIVAAAHSNEDSGAAMTVLRFLPDGALDAAFNGAGYRKISFDGFRYSSADQLLLLPDGRMLVSGTVRKLDGTQPKAYSCFARLTSTGALDASFGSAGRLHLEDTLDVTYPFAEVPRIALQPDGKWLLTSNSKVPENRAYQLRRFKADGSPDLDFGYNGVLTTDISAGHDLPTDLAVQADGKIVVAGVSDIDLAWPQSTRFTPALVRYLPNVKLLGVKHSMAGQSASLFPNPAEQTLYLGFSSGTSGKVVVRMTNLSGQVAASWTLPATAGKNTLPLNLPGGLPSGNYLLTIDCGAGPLVLPFTKR